MPEIAHQLGAGLKALRTMAGLTQRDIARRIQKEQRHPPQPRVHRIEIGEAIPSRDELNTWLGATNADEEARDRLETLLEAAHNPTHSWPGLLNGVNQLQDRARVREEGCRLTRNFQTNLIPGLLQTAEYARLLFERLRTPGADVAAQVAGRVARQRILYQEGRRFEFLVAEPALWWSPGPGVMPAQLDRLVSLSTLSTVELRVLPARREGAHEWHAFVYHEPADPEQPPMVVGELLHGEFGALREDDVKRYLGLWDALWAEAASGDAAVEVIRQAGR